MNIIFAVVFLLSVLFDQITKLWASNVLKDGSSIEIINEFLRFSYVENRGAAFGILQNQKWFFIVVTIVMLAILSYMFFKTKNISFLSRFSIVLIVGGAIGNFIDRLKFGYVIDFIDVRFGNVYDFPVFNIADVCVVIGTFLMIILIFFNKFEERELNG